ncbi:hypothetical protein B0H63DRAFT_495483 [Podospora didyma]|uniref:Lytic polysaccharide monooxygenase n=1 Tax=Podospora didyma TaxID=330526 RepID=A0AAE0NBS2_9PEZI|nr:hypothetical protein B0H63DRAFT_495483 [Podospora didyma]
MFSQSLLSAFAATAIFTAAHGHMRMNLPVPFNPHQASTFPLDPPGGRFPYPCQGFKDVAFRTPVVAGQSTLVNFTGSGTHGGGSCQFGVNYHGDPYTDNQQDWKTIYTIIGGCPAETTGNLEDPAHFLGLDADGFEQAVHCGDDKGLNCVRQFNVAIPADLPNGNATFAWIWYNKVTAGEVYMTCAPITVTAGVDIPADESTFLDSLPAMLVANIPGVGVCTTSKTGDQGVFNIPNPGRYGVQLIEPDPHAAGDCPVAPPAQFVALPPVGAPHADIPTVNTPAPPAATTGRRPGRPISSATGAAPTTPTSTIAVTVTSAAQTSTASVTVTTSSAVQTSSSPSQAATATFSTTPAAPTPSAGAGAVPCPVSGQLICIGETQFGICNSGFATPQQLNLEQVCRNGKVTLRLLEDECHVVNARSEEKRGAFSWWRWI